MIVGPQIRAVATQAVCLFLFVCIASGCDNAGRKANARLRREVHDLKQEVARLQRQEAEQRIQIEQATVDRPELDDEVLASTPMVTGISVSTLSGRMLDASDGIPTVELFISATDGRNRPIQMVGTLTARAVVIPAEGQPVDLGEVTLTPSQLRDAWRNVLGTPSYLVRLPIDRPMPDGSEAIHVRVFHEDARTGRQFEASGDVRPVHEEVSVE